MLTVKEDTEVFLLEEGKKVMKQQVADYSVYVSTWNVGSKFPENITLRNLLGLDQNEDGELLRKDLPDIYAIGFQEVNAEMNQQLRNMLLDNEWTEKVMELLNDLDYVTVQTEQMQGLLLCIFMKRHLVPHLRDIEAEYTRTGFGGMWGNKGAISIRFNLLGCALVFVEAHLAAHDKHLSERLEDYYQILKKHRYNVPRYQEIHDHDYVWWFGDLNFRLNGKDSAEEIRDAVVRGDFKSLLARDQLNHLRLEQPQCRAFEILQETTPTFPPTFKFKEGTSEYDMKRRPAWTDRILYGVQPLSEEPNPLLAIKQHAYRSHNVYKISDHKPVTAEFSIKLFPQHRDPCVTFSHIDVWKLGQENTVHYTKPPGFEERKHDWVGLFNVKYKTLRDYAAYEYVEKSDSSSESDDNEQLIPGEKPRKHRRHHLHHVSREQTPGGMEEVHLGFAEDSEFMFSGDKGVLIYFRSSASKRGVTSIAGMSNEFIAIRDEPNE